MDEDLVAIVGAAFAFIVFDLAAMRFGVNSRDGKRELPIDGEPSEIPRARGGHMQWWRHARHRDGAELVVTRLLVLNASAPERTPATHEIQELDLRAATTRPRRCVEPRTPAMSHCFLQLDLAARGK